MAEDVKYILRNCALNKGFMNEKKTINWSVQGQLSGRQGNRMKTGNFKVKVQRLGGLW